MKNFNKVVEEIILRLSNIEYKGDLSDIGNEIGIAVGECLDKDNTIEDFIHGLKHGVSLIDGTHG
jgi:hypothetical protein